MTTNSAELKQAALPFAILTEEMEALERFHECVTDGEGYDVPNEMMRRLAEIGLVRRVTVGTYEHTTFGLSVLNGDFAGRTAAQGEHKWPHDFRLYTVERLRDAMVTLGIATDDSLETFSADLENMLLSLCRVIASMKNKVQAGSAEQVSGIKTYHIGEPQPFPMDAATSILKAGLANARAALSAPERKVMTPEFLAECVPDSALVFDNETPRRVSMTYAELKAFAIAALNQQGEQTAPEGDQA